MELKLFLLLSLLVLTQTSYLEFHLLRMPSKPSLDHRFPAQCDNESVAQQAEYRQICYEKDINYVMPFVKDGLHLALAADFTIPISWIKGKSCKIANSINKCSKIIETVADKIKSTRKRLSKTKVEETAEIQDAIIAGSSEVIRGEIERSSSISFTSRDSSRLNNFFELILLGLFIYGEKDHLQLERTNFINATVLSPHLNALTDGALSLRFDETAQTSFLSEMFDYVKTRDRTVTVYLGVNHTLTVGDMTAKYSRGGFSSINWVSLPEDEGYGKLAQISKIAVEDRTDDNQEQTAQTLPAVFTLSASYIGLPDSIITAAIIQALNKTATCKTNANSLYLECSYSNKKQFQKLIKKNLIFEFGGPAAMIPLEKLLLSNEHKRAVFNIRAITGHRAILGEPIFLEYFLAFDYSKNRVGFGPKREVFNEFFIGVVPLVRFLCTIFFGTCLFIFLYSPCKKCLRKVRTRRAEDILEEKGLRRYAPIRELPEDDLKNRMQEVFSEQ